MLNDYPCAEQDDEYDCRHNQSTEDGCSPASGDVGSAFRFPCGHYLIRETEQERNERAIDDVVIGHRRIAVEEEERAYEQGIDEGENERPKDKILHGMMSLIVAIMTVATTIPRASARMSDQLNRP